MDISEIGAAVKMRPGLLVDDLDFRTTPGFYGTKIDGRAVQTERTGVLSELQEMLFANGRSGDNRSVLLVLQGMDTAGKGGIVRHVIGSVDPQGVEIASFGVPTEEEKSHHFLWRIERKLPRPGRIGVFDRSHYEDVLVARVRSLAAPEVIEARYGEINAWEKELVEQRGITVVKVAMFISLDEQRARLLERIERPDKYWKYNPGDIDERKLWPEYSQAYQIMLDRTSTDYAPWNVILADRKWYSRLAVTELLIDALTQLDLSWPKPDFDPEVEKKRLLDS